VKQTAQSLGGNAQEGSGNARRHRTAIAYAAPHKWQGGERRGLWKVSPLFSICSLGVMRSRELVDESGEIAEPLGGRRGLHARRGHLRAAVRRWPKSRIRLYQEARIVEDSQR
jgi:hypothetical protein